MANQDLYDQWLAKKKTVDVPDGFADRVMACIHREAPPRHVLGRESRRAGPVVQVGLATAAVIAFVLRFTVLFALAVG